MATITLNIPDAQVARVIDALCARGGYDPALGVTKAQFAKQSLAAWLKAAVQQVEQQQAHDAAVSALQQPPDIT